LRNGLKIVLHDTGRPFNPARVPPPEVKARLKDLKSRGAGLFLMQKMMDEVSFEFTQGGGNFLTMVKYQKNEGEKWKKGVKKRD
jgi:anti-sigma regulatory factor (Ser/Thr protein kinase)